MLILTRKAGEEIRIGPDVSVVVQKIGRSRVRIGVDGPAGIAIDRGEVAARKAAEGERETRRGL